MKHDHLLLRLAVLVAAMMCALGAAAAEAYACYTSSNTTLTFYYDNQRSSRTGTTYDLNTGTTDVAWDTDGTNASVTKVVFDSSFAGARPTTTCDWFYNMQNLQSITGLSYLNTSEVTNMNWMFLNCLALTSLDLSHFNTSKVTGMKQMLSYCSSLTSLDLSSFNTSKVTDMSYMFRHCYNLRTVYVGDGWSTAAVAFSNEMLYNCQSLVGGQGTTWNSSNPMDKTYAHIDGGPSNPGYFTEKGPEAYANYTPSNTTLTFYYDNQRSSRTGTTYGLNTSGIDPGWYTDGTNANVTKVVFDSSFAGARPVTTFRWFEHMENLTDITGMSYLNTSELTSMVNMFYYCSNLTSVDVSHLNTSNVKSMYGMFAFCDNLTSLDLSNWNTSQVNSMGYMFCFCGNLQTIYVGNGWSTDAVTSSGSMFSMCTSLVGGQGTAYNSSNPKDKTYAHIDGGPSNPGYFTRIEAYACYTSSNTTLTFYYDSQRSSRSGTTYDLNEGSNDTGWDTDGTNSSVTKVVFDPSFAGARPTTTCDWFYGMRNLESITGMSYLNTSEVTNMGYMFLNCKNLSSLDVSHFNTSKVINMNQLFSGCTGLTSLDLSNFNTSTVATMLRMFYNSTNLRTIYVGNGWSTAAVTYSGDMFKYCTSLVGGQGTTYDENHIDGAYAHIDGGTSNPGYFTEWKEAYACYTPSNTTLTFYYDNQRSSRTGTTYNLNTGSNDTGWDTDGTKSNVTKVVFDPSFAGARPTTTCDWFFNMQNLQSITGMSYLNTSEVIYMKWMFYNCNKLTSLDVSHFNTSKVIYMNQMFNNCTGLTSLDLSSFNTSNVTNMRYMFEGSTLLRTIYVGSGWSTAAVTNSVNMFNNCTSLVGGQGTTYDDSHIDKTYAHIDGGTSNPGYFTDKNAPVAYACYTPSNTTLTFYYDNQRSSRTGTTYDLNEGYAHPGWESDGTNASVTKAVFDPSFANARPTTTYDWFYGMENLQSITGMSYLNTSEVTNMAWMFGGCTVLTSLDLSHFNTSKVTDMGAMFYNCSILTSLDLSSFNTSKVTIMSAMFMNCRSLTSLDVSHFNTAKVTDMRYMFAGGLNLQTIYVGNDWSTAAVTESSDMFTNCYNLVGGKGTTYDANHIDKTYAHIDGGPSNPGYFTAKAGGLRGDVNHDGQVNITDVTTLISMIMSDNTSGNPEADVNSDGNVNITDVTTLITMVMGS